MWCIWDVFWDLYWDVFWDVYRSTDHKGHKGCVLFGMGCDCCGRRLQIGSDEPLNHCMVVVCGDNL